MTATIFVCKADQLLAEEEVPSVHLRIEEKIPSLTADISAGWHKRAENFYDAQASEVHEALKSLPQGTRHSLLILLLQEKTDIYRGP